MGDIYKKVQENRLKWNVHELRREDEYMGKNIMVMGLLRKRRIGLQKVVGKGCGRSF